MNSYSQSCLDNHRSFRILLQAMSRPGKIYQLPVTVEDQRAALFCALDCLLDSQVSYCLLGTDLQLNEKLQRTGAHPTAVDAADFLLAPQGHSNGQLLQAKRGRREFPDEGATILYAVEALSEGDAETGLPLRGPGIKSCIYPQIDGLAAEELAVLKQANGEYPLGIDSIFVDPRGQLVCIPRSTQIGEN